MVDRKARNKLAEEIRHFIECRTDNFEFDDAVFEIDTLDCGVSKICESIWLAYDDLSRHKMEGKWALTEEQTNGITRAIVFLKSDCEYVWPKWPIYYRVSRPFLWLVSLGWLTKVLDRHFHGDGEYAVWPFFTGKDYEDALKEPRYLSRNTRHLAPALSD